LFCLRLLCRRKTIELQYTSTSAFATPSFSQYQSFVLSEDSALTWCKYTEGDEELAWLVQLPSSPPADLIGAEKLREGMQQPVALIHTLPGRGLLRRKLVTPSAFDDKLAKVHQDAKQVANAVLENLLRRFPPREATDCLSVIHPSWWLRQLQGLAGKSPTVVADARAKLATDFASNAQVSHELS
jgi:hypothetical protein